MMHFEKVSRCNFFNGASLNVNLLVFICFKMTNMLVMVDTRLISIQFLRIQFFFVIFKGEAYQ